VAEGASYSWMIVDAHNGFCGLGIIMYAFTLMDILQNFLAVRSLSYWHALALAIQQFCCVRGSWVTLQSSPCALGEDEGGRRSS